MTTMKHERNTFLKIMEECKMKKRILIRGVDLFDDLLLKIRGKDILGGIG